MPERAQVPYPPYIQFLSLKWFGYGCALVTPKLRGADFIKALSTLLEAGLPKEILHTPSINAAVTYLETVFTEEQGLCGFGTQDTSVYHVLSRRAYLLIAPKVQADADDTSKAILSLHLLGRPVSCERMLNRFFGKDLHIHTYLGERNGSYSANCNALRAILACQNPEQHVDKIQHILSYLCEAWWKGHMSDKWVRLVVYLKFARRLADLI